MNWLISWLEDVIMAILLIAGALYAKIYYFIQKVKIK